MFRCQIKITVISSSTSRFRDNSLQSQFIPFDVHDKFNDVII